MQAHGRQCSADFAYAKFRLRKHRGTAAAISVVMWRRQFASQLRAALRDA